MANEEIQPPAEGPLRPRSEASEARQGRPNEKDLIGKITHYFGNIEVAVIELTGSLSVGDTIRIIGGEDTDFEQKVESMQIEHENVEKAKKGDAIGLKVEQKVREGYKVYKS